MVVAANWKPAKPEAQWTAWLALAWLLGAGVMLGRASVKVAGAEQLRRACRSLDDPHIAELVADARRAVKLTRQVRVAVTNHLTSPAVVGVIVPTLILPLSLLTTLSPEQLRFILLHELAHIRRGDYLANLFQLFAEALLFFNPAVWWLSHQVRREREACCDALAIELSGAPADYARTLVGVAETMLNPSPAAAPAFGNEREPSSLADRVQRLLVPGYRPSLRLTWRAMLAALVTGGVLLSLLAAGTRETVAATASLLESKPAATNSLNPKTGQPAGTDTNTPPLFTRTFKVDVNVFPKSLEGAAPSARTNSTQGVRDFFATLGVDLRPPKSIYFNDRSGALLVRASLADLDIIEQAIQVMNIAPPQVNVRAKFVEMSEAQAAALVGKFAKTNAQGNVSSILTESQTATLFKSFEKADDVDILANPSVTTLSGRQAQIQMVDVQTLVTGLSTVTSNNGATTNLFQTSPMPFGPVLDVVPYVSADGHTVQMVVIPTITEFLGYDDPMSLTNQATPIPITTLGQLPLPHFRVRQMTSSAIVWDGQTLMLGGFKSEVISRRPNGTEIRKPDPSAPKRHLFIFVTPTIIDPAGNRVHDDSNKPFPQNTIPPQHPSPNENHKIFDRYDGPKPLPGEKAFIK